MLAPKKSRREICPASVGINGQPARLKKKKRRENLRRKPLSFTMSSRSFPRRLDLISNMCHSGLPENDRAVTVKGDGVVLIFAQVDFNLDPSFSVTFLYASQRPTRLSRPWSHSHTLVGISNWPLGRIIGANVKLLSS
ncbi:hypothetical protein M408DRAFT_178516 [Serendipita vermifera MAFF 305830]|uniref:Uncharacterized protein n=1 Tax=Serendipita vermifera MAFF 305830 TaxID=933852 RepID=A0A0C3AI71_SERVB|nr:hypothetical protein M408DRAFT_178516 [Serendipita vermifera MAFF 305830]